MTTTRGPQSVWDSAARPAARSSYRDIRSNAELGTTITFPEDRSVDFDMPRVSIGTAVYGEGPTGVTVIGIDGGARTAVDRLGGAVGVAGGYEFSHALCFAGGSVHGLGAAAGVTDALLKDGSANTHFADLALVSGAVIYDFGVRDNAVVPDAALGRAAWHARRTGAIDVGAVGAGIGASVGKTSADRIERSGQGAAFARVGDFSVLAVTVVNAVGAVVDRDGTVLRGNIGPDGVRRHPAVDATAMLQGTSSGFVPGNTTLSAVITNARLTDVELAQFAKQVHASMHRAIQPFGTLLDGDCLFAVTTDEVDLPPVQDGRLVTGAVALGTFASEVMWDAVIESVR